jgi:hypothetical protein
MDHPLCQLGGIQGVEHQTPASRELDNSLLLSDLPADVGGLSSALNLSPSASVDLTTYVGGSLVRIEFPHTVRSQVGGGRKGDLRGLSSKSRREMLNFMNSINKDRLGSPPLLATLTYADRFPTDKATWTEHFNRRFRRRLARRFPGAAAIWRKEFQRRKTGKNAGKWAPHFHLLLFVEAEPSQLYEWLSQAWYESCGCISDDHLRSGTRVEPVRSWEGAMRYMAKRQGEVEELEQSVPSPGRSWGKWNADALPIQEQHNELYYDQGMKARRVLGKLTGVKPPVQFHKPTNMVCYVRYPTTQMLLAWLRDGADFEPGKAGAGDAKDSDTQGKRRNRGKGCVP